MALITLWPFTGFEVSTVPAGAVHQCERTIPRALIFGVLAVTAIYLSATTAVMLLVPPETLATSTAPFADAARGFGPWGAHFIAAGAMVATAGTLNGIIFTCGQMPMAVALDGLAPRWLAATNSGGAPHWRADRLFGVRLGSLGLELFARPHRRVHVSLADVHSDHALLLSRLRVRGAAAFLALGARLGGRGADWCRVFAVRGVRVGA